VEAGHAGSAAAAATGVEGAPGLTGDEVLQESIEGRLEHRLQTAEDEVTSGGGVDDKGQVVGYEVLGERVAFDAGKCGQAPYGPVGKGVQ
jgi:hypothetical protein